MSEQRMHVLLVGLRPTTHAPLLDFLHSRCGHTIDIAKSIADAGTIIGTTTHLHQIAVINLATSEAGSSRRLPSIAGLLAQLRNRNPSLQWIALTDPTSHARLAALQAGAYQALNEPLHPQELGMAIERAAEHQRLHAIARTYTDEQRATQKLEAIQRVSVAISSLRTLDDVLTATCRAAVELFDVDHSGLVLFDDDSHGHVVAEHPALGAQGLRIPLRGVAIEEQLLASHAPVVCSDVAREVEPGQVRAILEHFDIRSMLIVPVIFQDRMLGSFSLDAIGRRRSFSADDRNLCIAFAAQVAVALEHARLLSQATRRAEQLEKLARASNAMMDNLGALALDDRLTLIAQHASDILEAESGGIFLVQRPGIMTLEASFGHRPGGFEKGREYVICDAPEAGLTGAIAARGQLLNAHGEALRMHPARRGEAPHTPSECFSLLAIPLKRHTNAGEELIGLLRVDNKKDSTGQATPLIGFSAEDEWMLHLFASAALVAIEDAKLVAALRQQSDYLDRMIASLPNGVIAIDQTRRVAKFNQQAAAMLQYQQQEVLGTMVDALYDDPHEPMLIGRKLHEAPNGRLADHETFVRSKHGERIPIRLAATWIFDAQGQRIGSVGYFEDLRAAKETQRRLDVLLKASNIVAQADNFTEGLTRLAEMLVLLSHSSFCRIFLIDDTKQHLLTAAVYPSPDDRARLDWTPGLGSRVMIASWPGLDRFFDEGQPRVLRLNTPDGRSILEEWARRLQLRYDLQSLVMIPLRTKDRMVGLLDLGEIRPWELAPFTPDMLHLATAIADHTTALIDRMRLYAEADQQRLQFAELDAAARQLRAEKDPARLSQTIVGLAVHLAGGSAGGLFLNHPHIEEVELLVAEKFPEDNVGRRQQHSEGLIGRVARVGGSEIAHNYSYWREQDPLLEAYHFQSLIAVPLRHAGEVEAVLFIAHAANPYQFSSATLEILDRFAMHAALVLRTARQMSREQRAFGHLAILHQMSDYIQTAPTLDILLQVALTAITAGYGLGFNRAAVFLFDERREQLIGKMGIGHITPSEAERAWAEHAQRGLEDFRRYREQLEYHRLVLTPVGERVRQLRLSLGPIASDVFAQVIHLQKWRVVYPDEFVALPPRFAETLQPTTPVLAVPLVTHGVVIGMLVADNKFTREPITHEQIDSLLAFANTTAIAIDTHLLLHETNLARQKLQSFYEASNSLVWSQEPAQVLREIVEQARQTANARGVTMILFDTHERVRGVLTTGEDTPIDLARIVRPNGISIDVLRTGEPAVVEDAVAQRDRVNRTMFDHGIAAGLCLPVAIKGQRLGVMWVHYDTPRVFPAAEIAAIQLYVNQAAIAYDNARQIDALRKARDTARIVAHVTMLGELQPTLDSIVEGTKDVLGCDAVSLYQYHDDRNLLRQPPTTIGLLYPHLTTRTDAHALAAESFVYAMLNLNQMLLVEHTADDPRFAQRRFTLEEQVASCVVIPLRVGHKRVGVMFINYRQPHQFLPDEVTNIEIFAYQAAVAIYNAQLYDQLQRRAATLQRLYEAGRAISGTLAVPEILRQIAEQAHQLIGSDRPRKHISLLGLVEGDRLVLTSGYPLSRLPALRKKAGNAIDLHGGGEEHIGIAGRAALSGSSQRVGDVRANPDYVAYVPGTRSELAVPMRIRERTIGVINIEHPDIDAFDDDHQQVLELLAAQAAIALENAQLFEHTRGLHAITLAASSALQLDDVLRATAESIASEFGYESVGIHLIDEASAALSGPTYYAGPWPRTLNTNTAKGITGRVARTGESALVPDVLLDADYVASDTRTRSELCVPLISEQKVVGAINVESAHLNAFTSYDQHQLETIARQVVNRIENARLYTQLEQTKTMLAARTAVAWMGMVSAIWRHEIEGHAATISVEINTIRAELEQASRSDATITPRLEERLDKIMRMAEQILQHQIPPVPSGGDEAVSVQINDLLRERLRYLQEHDTYRSASFNFGSTIGDSVTIRISREWMCILFDILVDNAVAAMRQAKRQRVDIVVSRLDGQAHIAIKDTGKGIPAELQKILFHQQIVKAQGERGMGMGLLLAQTIAHTYGGEIVLESTSSKGTTMAVLLPIEQSREARQVCAEQ